MNPSTESSIQIEERAAEWLAQRGSTAWNESDEATFNAWLEQSTLHVVAFVRLEAAWKQAKRLKALSGGVPPGKVPAPEAWQLAPFFNKASRPETPAASAEIEFVTPLNPVASTPASSATVHRSGTVWRWAFAASVLIAMGGSIAFYLWPFDSTYRTPVGGTASVPISDGSRVVLNTNSQIRLDITETERRIELQKGEAFFDVAKDPSRPFIVEAGEKRVVAVGTQFSVRRDGQGVQVYVTEGKVRIEDESGSARDQGSEPQLFTLTAGSMAKAGDAGVLIDKKPVSELEGYLSWRTGHLIFRDTALADAVAEFNRYNMRKIVIEDPAVAAIRISGKFRSTQFEAFVRVLEDGFPVRARHFDDQIILTDRRKSEEGAAAMP